MQGLLSKEVELPVCLAVYIALNSIIVVACSKNYVMAVSGIRLKQHHRWYYKATSSAVYCNNHNFCIMRSNTHQTCNTIIFEGCGNCMHYYNLKFTPQFSILILVIYQVYSPSSYLRGFLRGQWLFPRESLQKLSNNRRHVLTSKHYLLGQGER